MFRIEEVEPHKKNTELFCIITDAENGIKSANEDSAIRISEEFVYRYLTTQKFNVY